MGQMVSRTYGVCLKLLASADVVVFVVVVGGIW